MRIVQDAAECRGIAFGEGATGVTGALRLVHDGGGRPRAARRSVSGEASAKGGWPGPKRP